LIPGRRCGWRPASIASDAVRRTDTDDQGQELRCFYDELPDAAREVLRLLGIDMAAYGLA
jgi:hypothetical protein